MGYVTTRYVLNQPPETIYPVPSIDRIPAFDIIQPPPYLAPPIQPLLQQQQEPSPLQCPDNTNTLEPAMIPAQGNTIPQTTSTTSPIAEPLTPPQTENPIQIQDVGVFDSVKEGASALKDQAVEGAVEAAVKPFGKVLQEAFLGMVNLANTYSVEIIMMGTTLCGAVLMVAPLLGLNTGKWLNRAAGVLFVGSIWRLMIS